MLSVPASRRSPLLSAMRSLGMGHWSCQAAERRLVLSADAAAIMGMDCAIPSCLDDLFSHFVAESAERLKNAFLACLGSGTPIDAEVLLASPPDRSRWVRFVGESVPDTENETGEIHGAVQDITTYKRVREETLRLTMRLTTTLASITEAFVTVDRQGRLTHVNRESERLLVRTAGQLLGRPIFELLDGEVQGLLRTQIENALAGNQRTEFEDFYPELDKWLEIRIHPYAEGLAMYLRDVSERRQSQNQLTLLRMGIERINDIVAVARVGGVGVSDASISFVNDAFERQTGFSREEVIGHPPDILRHVMGEDLVKSLAQEAIEPNAHTLLRREVLLRRRDGTTFWMDLDVVPVHDDQGQLTHWMAVGRDVTERRLAEEKSTTLLFSTRSPASPTASC
ncbi:PAS domain-containing protein [Ottowia caeni]|uniref:PAS domain-containing protein n=1 Tax=Ottowia caeni TaxID=2870339 RepID=UPI003D72C072